MIVNCVTDRCHCTHPLFTVEGFQGAVETKCPRCRKVHTFDWDGVTDATRDVRCTNSFKGQGLGGWCSQLIARISPDSVGSFGYRCPRCKESKTIRIQTPMVVST